LYNLNPHVTYYGNTNYDLNDANLARDKHHDFMLAGQDGRPLEIDQMT